MCEIKELDTLKTSAMAGLNDSTGVSAARVRVLEFLFCGCAQHHFRILTMRRPIIYLCISCSRALNVLHFYNPGSRLTSKTWTGRLTSLTALLGRLPVADRTHGSGGYIAQVCFDHFLPPYDANLSAVPPCPMMTFGSATLIHHPRMMYTTV